MLRFAQETILLLLDEECGVPDASFQEHSLHIVLAGAVLMDLAFEGRIDTDLTQLTVLDATPLNDNLLDPMLANIAQLPALRDIRFWLTVLAKRGAEIRETALARLVDQGILEAKRGGGLIFLDRTVSRSRRYPGIDGPAAEYVKLRVMRVLFSDEIPDPRDVALICLADVCGVFEAILSKTERARAQERLALVRKMDLIGQAVAQAIRELESVAVEAAPPSRQDIPQAPGLPLLGNTLGMVRGLHNLLIDNYRTFGPVFRIRTFKRHFLVLVGPEANCFLAQDKRHLRSLEPWSDFTSRLGQTKSLAGMDGPEHTRLRQVHVDYYSRNLLTNREAEAVHLMREEIDTWPLDTGIPGQHAFQRIVAAQLGRLTTNTALGDGLDDLIFFFDTMLRATAVHQLPLWGTSLPRFRRARKRLEELAQQLMTAHAPDNRGDRPVDLIDDLLAFNQADPHFLPETDLWLAALGPFAFGLDTVSTVLSFMSYELLQHPDLLAGVTAEADTLFAGEGPSLEALRRMDVTQRVIMETLRRYPLAPATLRTVANSFEFSGYQLPAGEQVLVGLTATHLMPEHFPDPQRFDIERYTPERAEHQPAGVYVPFGAGTHQCLGRSLAEVLLVLNIATLFHTAELRLDPPDCVLKVKQFPHPRPTGSFKLRVVRRRH